MYINRFDQQSNIYILTYLINKQNYISSTFDNYLNGEYNFVIAKCFHFGIVYISITQHIQ